MKARVEMTGWAVHTAKVLIQASAKEEAAPGGGEGDLALSTGKGRKKIREWVEIRGGRRGKSGG